MGLVEPGAVIEGKYRVLRRIGEGGMGTVYEGENTRIERRVAIKVLHAHVASSPEFAQRFEREARASARIGSQYVCDVLDLGDLPNGERYIVMEYLDGESLEDRLQRGRLTAKQLAPIAFELLDGLGAMHQAGVVHRDLKPANVFLAKTARGRQQVVKILDFGVAKIIPRGDESGGATQTGMMMGTPLYMSPEQARGARDVDGRTDLYAASVIFYRALTGILPHEAANLHELLFKIVLEDPRPILEVAPDVDPEFAAIVTRGLARDVNERYLSARQYQEELAAWGEKQKEAQLRFSVTLPSEQPPLRTFTAFPPAPGAMRASSPPGSSPPPAMPAIPIGPPTPAEAAVGDAAPARSPSAPPRASSPGGVGIERTLAAGAVPAQPPNGGTPMGWSEDHPNVTEAAPPQNAGGTVVYKSTPPPKPSSVPPPAAPPAEPKDVPASSMPISSVASSGGRVPTVPMVQVPMMRIAIGSGLAIAVLALVIGSRVMSSPTPSTAPSAEAPSAAVSTATVPVDIPDPPPATATTASSGAATDEPAGSSTSAPSTTASAPTPPTAPARDAAAAPWVPPVTVVAAPPIPKPSATPAPPPSTTSTQRKFRTKL